MDRICIWGRFEIMKKTIIAIVIVISAISIAVYASNMSNSNNAEINLDFTNKIIVIDDGITTTTAIITDQNDMHNILLAMQNGIKSYPRGLDTSGGKCPSGVELVFEGNDEKVRVSFAGDDCDPVFVDGNLLLLENEDKTMIFNIIRKYGIEPQY